MVRPTIHMHRYKRTMARDYPPPSSFTLYPSRYMLSATVSYPFEARNEINQNLYSYFLWYAELKIVQIFAISLSVPKDMWHFRFPFFVNSACLFKNLFYENYTVKSPFHAEFRSVKTLQYRLPLKRFQWINLNFFNSTSPQCEAFLPKLLTKLT